MHHQQPAIRTLASTRVMVYNIRILFRFLELFMSKRNDAVPAEHIKPYNAVIPYLMRKRSDSLVYHRFSLDITPSVHFIEQKNAEAEEKK